MHQISSSQGRRIGYIRVNSLCGDLKVQLANVQLDMVFKDTIVRKRQFLSEFERMRALVREGDTLVVERMDRLGRNPDDFLHNIRELTRRGVRIECASEQLYFPAGEESPLRNLLLLVMMEFHRTMQSWVSERGRESRSIEPDLVQSDSLNRTVEICEEDFGN